MASVGHVFVGMVAARLWHARPRTLGSRVQEMALWSALSLLPDVDVIGFPLGVAYAAPWGHRGATHSLAFAVLVAMGVGFFAHASGLDGRRTAILAAVVVASHGLLDALTDGGLGCALLWPFSNERFFAPWRPLPVAPIGPGLLSMRGLRVAIVELVVFSPLLAVAFWPRESTAKAPRAPGIDD